MSDWILAGCPAQERKYRISRTKVGLKQHISNIIHAHTYVYEHTCTDKRMCESQKVILLRTSLLFVLVLSL